MAFAHNAMIRGINSIYNQAPNVRETEDIVDFLFFVRSWANWVGHHHHLEETLMFPSFEKIMEKPGFLQANIEQHHAFEPGLNKLRDFTNDTKPDDYSFEVLQGIIQDFASGLQQHLREEIPTLLAMRPYDSNALLKAYKASEFEAGKQDKVKSNAFTCNALVAEAGYRRWCRQWYLDSATKHSKAVIIGLSCHGLLRTWFITCSRGNTPGPGGSSRAMCGEPHGH